MKGDNIAMSQKINLAVFVFVFSVMGCFHLFALEMTPGLLFDKMENSTERIDSLQTDMVMISGPTMTRVAMAIQSPDKFAVNFIDRSIKVVFDGERLWVYIEALNEVFTLDATSSGGWFSDALREYVNPKKIITNITRSTLFTFFDITMVPTPTIGEAWKPAQASSTQAGEGSNTPLLPATFPVFGTLSTDSYNLRFVPLGSYMMKKMFEVGHYEIVFSSGNFLPNRVLEYAPDGSLRGFLQVIDYKINSPLPKEMFVFEPPPGAKVVPLLDVIKQKIEQSKDAVVEKMGDLLDGFKEKMEDWGF